MNIFRLVADMAHLASILILSKNTTALLTPPPSATLQALGPVYTRSYCIRLEPNIPLVLKISTSRSVSGKLENRI
jgi:hypothetical protein